ncbi:hypothetical protein ACHHYP_09370 [Achlya hypogyna]|uniref:Transmembrane protein n=1 Tax=Achlya hypogyna TaxID=1202772 RepID=A0A1V9ZJ01_ACHHY|nr:hypothetical protein ACHHYP_09370 [Achlya hypogyna]
MNNEEGIPLVDAYGQVNRALHNGNFSVWWLIGAVLSLWFTAYKGLAVLFGSATTESGKPVGPVFAIHLVTCCLISWICIWNLFHTPSHGPIYRTMHVVLGRSAMISGVLSAGAGFYAAWWERYDTSNLGFTIGVSVGGCLQLVAQTAGWYFIRQRNVLKHQKAMYSVFFYGCLIPMWLRFPNLVFGLPIPDWWSIVAIACSVALCRLAFAAHTNKRSV